MKNLFLTTILFFTINICFAQFKDFSLENTELLTKLHSIEENYVKENTADNISQTIFLSTMSLEAAMINYINKETGLDILSLSINERTSYHKNLLASDAKYKEMAKMTLLQLRKKREHFSKLSTEYFNILNLIRGNRPKVGKNGKRKKRRN